MQSSAADCSRRGPALVGATPVAAASLGILFVVLLVLGACLPLPRQSPTPRTWTSTSAVLFGVVAFAIGRVLVGGHPPLHATAFVLVTNTLAAVAEEAWFRRLCFGLLAPAGTVIAVIGSSVLFAAVHVSIYGFWILPLDLAAGLLLRLAAIGHRIVGGTRDHPRRREPAGGALSVRRRSVVLAVAVLATYVVALAFTVALRDDHVRPLYDGFSTPAAYRWVDPPPFFESGNVEPTTMTATVRSAGTARLRPAHDTRRAVRPQSRTGCDRREAASAEDRDREAHAGRAERSGRPSIRTSFRRQRVPAPDHRRDRREGQPARAPGQSRAADPRARRRPVLLARREGVVQARVACGTTRELNLAAKLDAPGYYLAGTNLPELVAPADESDHAVAIGVATAALTAVVLVVAFVLVRRRSRRRNVNAP